MLVCVYLRVFVAYYCTTKCTHLWYTIFMCFNVAHYFVNTLLQRSSFCYRISWTPIEETNNSLTKIISKNEPLNLHGICIAVIIQSTIFIMGVRGSRKGYGNPKRISFSWGFSFPLRLEPCGPWQLNVMAICARQE